MTTHKQNLSDTRDIIRAMRGRIRLWNEGMDCYVGVTRAEFEMICDGMNAARIWQVTYSDNEWDGSVIRVAPVNESEDKGEGR